MFKIIDMPTSDGMIRQAFHRLIRTIQTEVEHKRVYNDSGDDYVKGDIVYQISDGTRYTNLAINTAEGTADWIGVMAEPTDDGAWGVARTEGYALVRFKATDTLTAQEGLPVYVSDEAGAATITQPSGGGAFSITLGILGDATIFDGGDYPYAWVFLGHCCELSVNQPG
jgi:hypothetical protein